MNIQDNAQITPHHNTQVDRTYRSSDLISASEASLFESLLKKNQSTQQRNPTGLNAASWHQAPSELEDNPTLALVVNVVLENKASLNLPPQNPAPSNTMSQPSALKQGPLKDQTVTGTFLAVHNTQGEPLVSKTPPTTNTSSQRDDPQPVQPGDPLMVNTQGSQQPPDILPQHPMPPPKGNVEGVNQKAAISSSPPPTTSVNGTAAQTQASAPTLPSGVPTSDASQLDRHSAHQENSLGIKTQSGPQPLNHHSETKAEKRPLMPGAPLEDPVFASASSVVNQNEERVNFYPPSPEVPPAVHTAPVIEHGRLATLDANDSVAAGTENSVVMSLTQQLDFSAGSGRFDVLMPAGHQINVHYEVSPKITQVLLRTSNTALSQQLKQCANNIGSALSKRSGRLVEVTAI